MSVRMFSLTHDMLLLFDKHDGGVARWRMRCVTTFQATFSWTEPFTATCGLYLQTSYLSHGHNIACVRSHAGGISYGYNCTLPCFVISFHDGCKLSAVSTQHSCNHFALHIQY